MAILVENKDTNLYTDVYPNSGQETVILLHGGPGVPDGLGPVAAFLSPHLQVISFHQRGTRNSPCFSHRYALARYVSDIDTIARHFNLQQFHLFGHSWGGLYAQLYAQHRPGKLRSLFLCSPASGTGWQWVEMALEIARFNRKRCPRPAWQAMKRNALLGFLGSDKAYQKFYTQFCLNCNRGYGVADPVPLLVDHVHAKPINRTNRALVLHGRLRKLPNPGFPITVTYGDDDVYGDSPRYIRQRYPTADFRTIPGSSHFPWLQNGPAFFNLLAAHYQLESAPRTGFTPQDL
jgi:proline iminopeptidase